MDWTNTAYTIDLGATLIDPLNVNKKIGDLKGIIFDGLDITENYNADSRIQAKLATVTPIDQSDGYKNNARIRIILSIPDRAWSKELITGYVSDIKVSQEANYIKREYTIESTMWGLLNHRLATPVTINKGSNMINIWTDLMTRQTKMQYSTTGAQNRTFNNTIIYEPGTVLATLLFEISEGYSRMDVDGHGRIILKRYIAPSKQTPSRTIDLTDERGLVYGSFTKSSSEWSTSGREIVTATITGKNNSQQVIAGYYDAPANHRSSIKTRGYLVSQSTSYSGSNNSPTKNELAKIAESNWKKSQSLGIDWQGTSIYADYHAGDVVWLSTTPLTKKKCLIREVDTHFSSFSQDLTLEEI